MRNEPPINDPQTIWQNQSTEEMKMSPTQFIEKTEQHRARARSMAIANDLAYIAALVFLGFNYTQVPNATSRAGLVLMAVGCLFVVYRSHKQLWPPSPAPDAPPATGLEAYRRELQRWRDNSRNWRVMTPLIPGCIVFVLPFMASLIQKASGNPAILINALPFLLLFATGLALMFPMRRRRLRKIQREIDMLDRLAGASSESPGQL